LFFCSYLVLIACILIDTRGSAYIAINFLYTIVLVPTSKIRATDSISHPSLIGLDLIQKHHTLENSSKAVIEIALRAKSSASADANFGLPAVSLLYRLCALDAQAIVSKTFNDRRHARVRLHHTISTVTYDQGHENLHSTSQHRINQFVATADPSNRTSRSTSQGQIVKFDVSNIASTWPKECCRTSHG
jgi:hypothetical protein